MKLVTFLGEGNAAEKAGVMIDDETKIVALQAADNHQRDSIDGMFSSVLALLEGGPKAMERVSDVVSRAISNRSSTYILERTNVRLLAPITRPPQMRDFLCFEKHLVQAFRAARRVRAERMPDPAAAMKEMEASGVLSVPQVWYERPIFYHPNRLNVIGTDQDVFWPSYSKVMDFELELGAVIGKSGRDISREQARQHIVGYTIFNDFSARDEQVLEMPGQLGPGKGKDFDGSNVLGPWLVTADEIADPYNLAMSVRVNGEEWGRGNTSDMRWRFEDCIAHVGRSETIHSGEIFGSGTVGNGCGLEQMRFLKDGDVVELEIEGIGVLRNCVRGAACS
jgi:2-keto-4-pentenoate hydratase/2-oxohepta-3-ene-1,7-dioic acid hydratase in catechol pathway